MDRTTKQCELTHIRWGRCQQPVYKARGGMELCRFHHHWLFVAGEPDAYYAEKVHRGVMVPVEDYLSPREIETTVRGRSHGDGRRLDHYVLDEPIEWTDDTPIEQIEQALNRKD